MKTTIVTCLVLVLSTLFAAPSEVWIKVEKGSVLYLNPEQMEWTPVSAKERLSTKSFIITKPGASASVFRETEVYKLPANAYFYLDDVLHRNRVQIVAALTQIEAEQLPVNTNEPGDIGPKVIGLTYGKSQEGELAEARIPHEQERLNAIEWFYEIERLDAALLTLKRTMTKFPSLYLREFYVERLLTLYDKLHLYGFLLDESNRLLVVKQSESYSRIVTNWHGVATQKLVDRRKN